MSGVTNEYDVMRDVGQHCENGKAKLDVRGVEEYMLVEQQTNNGPANPDLLLALT